MFSRPSWITAPSPADKVDSVCVFEVRATIATNPFETVTSTRASPRIRTANEVPTARTVVLPAVT
jgi:hypothetical protein